VWTNITPSSLDLSQSPGGIVSVSIDPGNTAVIYFGAEIFGIWKSTDAGATWAPIATESDPNPYDDTTGFIDLPIDIKVDPGDPNHIYATEGVRGANNGFWVTTDGGVVWTREKFRAASPTLDVTTLAVDPADFNHAIIGSHDGVNVGVIETTDGGDSFAIHPAPDGWPGGSYGLGFLYHPASGTGDANTWVVHHEGVWKTTNAGDDWKKVADYGGIHGATERYYTAAGVVYSGANGNPLKSTDNGDTWKQVNAGGGGVFPSVVGDGNLLYVFMDNFNPSTCQSSPESDGETWTPFAEGGGVPRAPLMLRYDPNGHIVYSANWDKGIWALKIADP
jgi:photosystem II stability/assembly factor-like uncharacterized protein